jgi:hypothetical protein
MKTVEEKARDASCDYGIDDIQHRTMFASGYLKGYNEATRWRDPKVELPENGEPVIVKYMTAKEIKKYGIAKYFELGIGNPWTIEGSTGREVIGWRPIE